MVVGNMAVNDGEIFLGDTASFESFAKGAGGLGILGNEHDAAGFAVETVDERRLDPEPITRRCRATLSMNPRPLPPTLSPGGGGGEIKPGAANQAGHLAVFGRMTDQPRRFVDYEQVGVFVDDIQHGRRFKVRGVEFKVVKSLNR